MQQDATAIRREEREAGRRTARLVVQNSGMTKVISALTLTGLIMNSACNGSTSTPSNASAPAGGQSPVLAALEKKIAQFAPVDIGANVDALPANEREALMHMVE